MISIFSPDYETPVYCQRCFWGDEWDASEYAQELNFDEPFFDQYARLMKRTPKLGVMNRQPENSEYCNYANKNKNCFLVFSSHYEEDCINGSYSTKNKDCVDYFWLYQCQLCVECSFCSNCYKSAYLDHCYDCSECYFSIDLKGCSNCILSQNLRNKQYYILNTPYSKEAYDKKLKEYHLSGYASLMKMKDYFRGTFRRMFPFRHTYHVHCEDCTGDDLEHCKGMRDCFKASDSEQCTYSMWVGSGYDSMDSDFLGFDRCELCYQTDGCNGLYSAIACETTWQSSHVRYCTMCFSSSNLFGCVGLKEKDHCILNKQYSETEYSALTEKLKVHMEETGEYGHYFPPHLSPFGYNETMAGVMYPLEKEQAIVLGFNWRDALPFTTGQETMSIDALPDDSNDIKADTVGAIFACVECGRNYRLTKEELSLFKKMNLPVPRSCPQCRYSDKFKRMNPNELWHRQCMCEKAEHGHSGRCPTEFETTYLPDRPEQVYCEQCYQKVIV